MGSGESADVGLANKQTTKGETMDATGAVTVLSSGDSTAHYLVAGSPQGRVVVSGPYATLAEANKAKAIPF